MPNQPPDIACDVAEKCVYCAGDGKQCRFPAKHSTPPNMVPHTALYRQGMAS